MKNIILSASAPAPIGPYSQAVKFGNTLFASGQIAINPANGELVQGSIKAETRQVMENLKQVLASGGMDFTNVVKCSIFLSDMDNFGVVNEIYGEYFPENPPARETVEVARLPKDVNVEISLIAME